MFDLPFAKTSPSSVSNGFGANYEVATLVAGYPVALINGTVDLTNPDCTVISNGIAPIFIFAQAGVTSTGAGFPQVALMVREGATVRTATGNVIMGASGAGADKTSLEIAVPLILPAGTHNLKLSIIKGAGGAGQVTSNQGPAIDTFLTAVY